MNLRLFLALFLALRDPDKRALMDFYEAEIRFLRSHLPKRPIPTLSEKAALSACAVKVGRKALKEVLTLFTPDTLFRWHREAVKQKWDYSKKRGPGRPLTKTEIERLILRLAKDNPTWGLTRLRDVLFEQGHRVARNT
jgi:putative transposase